MPKLVLLALTLSAGVIVPAYGQMRALDPSLTAIPPGVMRTISFAPDGHPVVVNRPYAEQVDIQPVQVVTVQTTEEDEDGNPIRTTVETRLQPITAFAYNPQGPGMAYMPSHAAQPMVAPHDDPQMLASLVSSDADLSTEGNTLPLTQTALDIPTPIFDDDSPAEVAQGLTHTPIRAGDFDAFSMPALLRSAPIVAFQAVPEFGAVVPAVLSNASARALSIHRDPRTGHFIAPIRINGVTIQAIVDTGAQDTILSAQDARATGAAHDIVRSEPMAGIGGYTMLSVARLHSMEVAGQNLGSFTAAIGQEGIPYTLLGQTEINRLGRIVIEDGVMTITPRAAQMAFR